MACSWFCVDASVQYDTRSFTQPAHMNDIVMVNQNI